jgi:hypothetical protein
LEYILFETDDAIRRQYHLTGWFHWHAKHRWDESPRGRLVLRAHPTREIQAKARFSDGTLNPLVAGVANPTVDEVEGDSDREFGLDGIEGAA